VALRLDEFLKLQFVPVPYVIGRGVLPVRGKLILGGAPKSNKSFVALNMLLAITKGTPIFEAYYKNGKPVLPVPEPCRVLYLEQELGEQGLLERLRGTQGRPGLVNGEASELELYVKPKDAGMRLDTPEGEALIREEIKAIRPHVVCADPMAKFHLSDENSAQEMGAVMRVIDHLIEDYGVSWIMPHHTGLAVYDTENIRRGGARLRGSSAIFADVDTFMEVQRLSPESHPEPVLRLTFEMRRGEPIEPLFVQRLRSGKVIWLGEGFEPQARRGGRESKYAHL
jgi:RecA-family ATPase